MMASWVALVRPSCSPVVGTSSDGVLVSKYVTFKYTVSSRNGKYFISSAARLRLAASLSSGLFTKISASMDALASRVNGSDR